MAKKKAAAPKPTDIDLVKEDLASMEDRLDVLAAKVAFLETFRPSIEIVREEQKPVSAWWRWCFGDGT